MVLWAMFLLALSEPVCVFVCHVLSVVVFLCRFCRECCKSVLEQQVAAIKPRIATGLGRKKEMSWYDFRARLCVLCVVVDVYWNKTNHSGIVVACHFLDDRFLTKMWECALVVLDA